MYYIIDLQNIVRYPCHDKLDVLERWQCVTRGSYPIYLTHGVPLDFSQLNITGKDCCPVYERVGMYWEPKNECFWNSYVRVMRLKRFQVIDSDGRSIDIRTWKPEIALANAGHYPAKPSKEHIPVFRREPAGWGRKVHTHRKGGCTMWRASMREVFCGDDDELTEFRPVIDRSKSRNRGFSFDAGWDAVERRHNSSWTSSKCWKDQSKSGRQWAQHKRGVSGKAIRDKRCPEPYMDIAEMCADIIAG